jgi:hypothetical protein
MAITPTPIKQQVPAPNNPANYNSTVSTTPGLTGTSAVMEPAGATPADWGASANVGVFGFGTTVYKEMVPLGSKARLWRTTASGFRERVPDRAA